MRRSLLLLALLGGCGSSPSWVGEGFVARFQRADPEILPTDPRFKTTVQVQWLGVAGFLISLEGRAVLLAPFYSKQGMLQVGLGTLDHRDDIIDRRIPKVGHVSALLIGHAHYDHLMDVPYILGKHATKAVAYGSPTAVNILAGFAVPAERRREAKTDDWTYVADRRIRFAAFRSEHAPHVGRIIHLWDGKVPKPLRRPPRAASQYQEGQPLSYLIEFLDAKGEPVFSLFFNDSSNTGLVGAPTIPHRPVDVMLACVPSWTNVDRYPEEKIAKLRPKHIVLHHFDDFFQDPEEPMEFLFHGETEDFLREVQRILRVHKLDAVVHMPSLDARMNFPTSLIK